MAGQIKKMIDSIIEQRSKGNSVIANLTKSKLAMKGIIYEKYTDSSEDDPNIIEKLYGIANDLHIKL